MTKPKYANHLPTDVETIARSRELVGTNLDQADLPLIAMRILHVLEALTITQQGILQKMSKS